MANELFTVRGILRGITESVDRGGLFLNAQAFRDLMVLPEGMHQIIVRKPDNLELAEAVLRVRELAPNQDVKSWRQLFPTLASVMESASGAIYVMFFIVYIAIGIVILNAMLMAVFERIREFGVLKAIGVSPGGVLRLILLESAIQAALAIAIGVGLSVPGLWLLSTKGIDMSQLGGVSLHGIAWDPIWRAEVSPSAFAGPIVTLLVVVLAAAIYPALKAALLSPVKAIHHR
jgi:ABC-type lipoprotein release transport system permease subunit